MRGAKYWPKKGRLGLLDAAIGAYRSGRCADSIKIKTHRGRQRRASWSGSDRLIAPET
jgi:hypothetical protein